MVHSSVQCDWESGEISTSKIRLKNLKWRNDILRKDLSVEITPSSDWSPKDEVIDLVLYLNCASDDPDQAEQEAYSGVIEPRPTYKMLFKATEIKLDLLDKRGLTLIEMFMRYDRNDVFGDVVRYLFAKHAEVTIKLNRDDREWFKDGLLEIDKTTVKVKVDYRGVEFVSRITFEDAMKFFEVAI